MRTTVNIDDALLAKARVLAAETGRSLGDVVDDALRSLLAMRERQPARQPVVLPTYGGSGLRPGVDLEDKNALEEVMDDRGLY